MYRTALGLASITALLASVLHAQAPSAAPVEIIRPTAKDGRTLNLDFETGSLADWTAEGEAFQKQPMRGDTVEKRRPGMRSRHTGEFWISSYEVSGDKPQGTLTSAAFKVTQPFASFRLAGGPHRETAVELLDAEGKVFYHASGHETEDLEQVAVDLRGV